MKYNVKFHEEMGEEVRFFRLFMSPSFCFLFYKLTFCTFQLLFCLTNADNISNISVVKNYRIISTTSSVICENNFSLYYNVFFAVSNIYFFACTNLSLASWFLLLLLFLYLIFLSRVKMIKKNYKKYCLCSLEQFAINAHEISNNYDMISSAMKAVSNMIFFFCKLYHFLSHTHNLKNPFISVFVF